MQNYGILANRFVRKLPLQKAKINFVFIVPHLIYNIIKRK